MHPCGVCLVIVFLLKERWVQLQSFILKTVILELTDRAILKILLGETGKYKNPGLSSWPFKNLEIS